MTQSPHTDIELQGDDALGDVIEDQESLKRERARRAAQMNTIFHAFDRFITLLRVYPTGHPLVDNFAHQLADQINEYIDEHNESMFVRVRATELLTEWDEPFFSRDESERDHFLWYPAAADGMISFDFMPGVTAEELTSLMQVINIADLDQMPLDDDTVTLLWERDLQLIDHHALEGYIDAGELGIFGNLSEPEAKAMVMSAAIAPDGEQGRKLSTMFAGVEATTKADVFTKLQHKASPLDKLPEVPADVLADAFRVDTSWVADLIEEWLGENNLEYRLIESLLSIVRVSPESEHGRRAADTIFELTTQLLDRHSYDVVITVLKLLHARRALFEASEGIDPLGEILDHLSDPLRLEALIYQAQKQPAHRVAIVRLLKLLDPDNVQKHILTTLSTPNKEVRALGPLVGILIAVSTQTNQQNLIAEQYTSKEVYLERMLRGLRGKDLSAHPLLPRLMSKAIEHGPPKVQKLALEMADRTWCSPMILDRFISPMMSHEDQSIRKLAIDVIRDFAPSIFEAWLDENIEADKLIYRAPGEIRFMLDYYLDEDPAHADALLPMLETHGWFNEQRRALARNVALVLLRRNHPGAIELVRQYADSFFTSRALRDEYRELLERFASATEDEGLASEASELISHIDTVEASEATLEDAPQHEEPRG